MAGSHRNRGIRPKTLESKMKNIAEFNIIGRVSRFTKLGAVVKIDIAANYGKKDKNGDWKDDAYWNSVTIFDESAQAYIEKHVGKGDLVFARGRLRQNRYEKDGATVYTVDLIANDFSRLAKASEDAGEGE